MVKILGPPMCLDQDKLLTVQTHFIQITVSSFRQDT